MNFRTLDRVAMELVIALLVLCAIVCGALGVMFLAPATLGVGIIAVGCLLGIIARIAQASAHHTETMKGRP